MKSWLHILLVCFVLLGGTAFFSYWYINQFNQVFNDIGAYNLTNTHIIYQPSNKPTPEVAGVATSTDETMIDEEITEEPEEPVVLVLIKETRLGYLNARTGPGTGFEKILELEPGNEYELIEKENGWYHLKIDEDTDAWVISTFAELLQSR